MYFKGDTAKALEKGLLKQNYAGIFKPVESTEQFMEAIKALPLRHEKHLIVFKGSRSNHLEEYVKTFMEQNNAL